MNRLTYSLVGLILLPCVLLMAGTTGKISGRVTDRSTGEGLVGANIVVTGTTLGAAADRDGNYVIINTSPGKYNVRVTLIGYASTTIKDVRVAADQTTVLDVTLETSAVEMADIIVQAERPMVQKDMTATSYVVSSEQIKLLPVKDFVEVLQLQAGVVADERNLYIRGGRSNEVAYLIDGMYVRDPVLGRSGTRINNDAIEELNFLSGTYSAEYGSALSGVVNIVTKEGTKTFTGQLEARTSEFGIKEFKDIHENRVSASLSGPLGSEDVTFFATGERDARGSWLPYGYDKTTSSLAKISAKVMPEIKVSATGRYTEDLGQSYNHDYKYIPQQYLRTREYSRQAMLTITHSVAQNLFYDARFSYFAQSYYSGLDKDTSRYLTSANWEYLPVGNGFEFYSLATPLEITDNRTETYNFKGDMVWQIGKANEVKFGLELKKHSLSYLDIYDPKRDHPYITDFNKRPLEGSAYLLDKIELRALVVNLGLRFDYANQLTSFRRDPLIPASVVDSKPKNQISPRLGVAHPISDRTSLHFSYGRFFQNPDYSRLYENSQYDISVKEPLFGQPDLDAERTTLYEVGLVHQFSNTMSGAFTAYYKDVTGLVSTQYFFPYIGGRYIGYTLYVNEAYAGIKGFEVNLNMRRTNYLAGSLTYTYSVAKGSASSEQEDYPGTTTSTLLYPLDWDRTHSVNMNVSLHFPDNDGPRMFGGYPLENMFWNFVLRAGSGLPYTPTGRDVGFVEKNSARRPTTYSLDAEISKDWKISMMTLTGFVEILNLTDHQNVLHVWTDTGEPDFTLVGRHSQEYMQDPSNYGPPRRVRLGVRLRFL
jgi:outer membrane receptor protein involved in Fe transport